MANFFASYPGTSSGGGSSNPSVGPNGAPIPADSTLVAGENPSGNLQPLQTDNSGNLLVSIAAEPGAPIDVNIADYGGTATTLGQKASAASMPVVIASDQSTLPISAASLPLPTGASTSALQTSGNATLTAIEANQTNGTQTTEINNGGTTVAVKAASTPAATTDPALVVAISPNNTPVLPSGAATAANQTNGSQETQIVQGGNTAIVTAAGALTVDGSAVTQPISAASLPLPTGASTSANQTNGTQTTMINNGANTAAVKAASTPAATTDPALVVAISPNNSITTSNNGNVPLQFVRNVYSSTNVTTAAYVQLIASTSGVTNVAEIFDSSGQTLAIAFGSMGSEVQKFIVYPGGNGRMTLAIPASTRVSIIALSATASSGELDLNLYT